MSKKFHSEAETTFVDAKTAARAVMSCKTMLQAAYSGYFTSVASEMGTSSPKNVLVRKNASWQKIGKSENVPMWRGCEGRWHLH